MDRRGDSSSEGGIRRVVEKGNSYIFLACLALIFLSSAWPAAASMPPGHSYAALLGYERMPPKLRRIVDNNMNAYLLGAWGHDLAYWAPQAYLVKFVDWIVGYGKDPGGLYLAIVEQPGMFLHDDGHSGDLIVKMLELATTKARIYGGRPGSEDEADLAFTLGWISHWITDTYVHTLVNRYGGPFNTDAGKRRHTQLELVESEHVAAEHGFPKAKVTPDRARFQFLARSLGSVYPQTEAFQSHWTSRVDETCLGHCEVVQDYEAAPFVDMLEYGAAIMADANNCLRQSAEPSVANAGLCLSEFGWSSVSSIPVTGATYRQLMNPIKIDVTPNPGAKKVEISATIEDYGLYGKFCRDWDRVIAQAVARHAEIFNAIDRAFDFPGLDPSKPGPTPPLPASLVRLFPNLDIIVPETPAHKESAALPPDVLAYYDDTVRGDPYPLKSIYYEFKLGDRKENGHVDLKPAKMEYASGFCNGGVYHSLPEFMGPIKLNAPLPRNLPAPVSAPMACEPWPGEAKFDVKLLPTDVPLERMELKISLTDARPFDHPMDGATPRFKGVEFDEPSACGWTLIDEWTSSYASSVQATSTSPGAPYGRVTFTEATATITSLSGATTHTWSAPPKCLAPGSALALDLKVARTGGTFGRAYTFVFYGEYSAAAKGWPTGVMIPPIMDWAGKEPDQGALFEGKPLTFSASRRNETVMIDARRLPGGLSLVGGSGDSAVAKWSWKVPPGAKGKRFLLIVSSGHAQRHTMVDPGMDTDMTVGAGGARYYEYVWKQ
jgi:hypothetical protein